LDIPMFTSYADSKTLLTDENDPIDGAIHESGYRSVRALIESLGGEDRRRQVALIRMSFRALSAHEERVPENAELGWRRTEWSVDTFTVEAHRIAGFLIETAIRGSRNEAAWVALNKVPTMDRYTVGPLDHGLWSGSAGIGLFLAALYG